MYYANQAFGQHMHKYTYIYLIHTTLMLSTVLQAQCTCTCIHCTGIWFCDQWYNELIALWLRN